MNTFIKMAQQSSRSSQEILNSIQDISNDINNKADSALADLLELQKTLQESNIGVSVIGPELTCRPDELRQAPESVYSSASCTLDWDKYQGKWQILVRERLTIPPTITDNIVLDCGTDHVEFSEYPIESSSRHIKLKALKHKADFLRAIEDRLLEYSDRPDQ